MHNASFKKIKKTSLERAPIARKIPISRFLYVTDAEIYVVKSIIAKTNMPMPTYSKILAIVLIVDIFSRNYIIN